MQDPGHVITPGAVIEVGGGLVEMEMPVDVPLVVNVDVPLVVDVDVGLV